MTPRLRKGREERYVPIDSVIPYENNPRVNDDAVEMVRNSLEAFGWRNPIRVTKDMVVIAGHTRLKAARELGMKEVLIVVDDDLSEVEAKAYRIFDNSTSEKSYWNLDLLAMEIKDIRMDFDPVDFGLDDIELVEKESEPEIIEVSDNVSDECDNGDCDEVCSLLVSCHSRSEAEDLAGRLRDEGHSVKVLKHD